MNEIQRQHPLFVVHAFSKYLILLIFPLLRSFVLLQGNVLAWVQGTWFDILVLLGIIGAGVAQWWCIRYTLYPEGVLAFSGVLIQEKRYIPYRNFSSIVMEEPFYLLPFRAARLRLETDSGSTRHADLTLLLRRRQAEQFLNCGAGRFAAEPCRAEGKRSYHPRALYIAILSLITSNTITGVLFAATFLSQSGKVLGEQFERMLLNSFTRLVQFLAFKIPPAAALAAAVLLGGWALAFLITLVSNLRFRAERKGRLLTVKSGIVTRKEYYLAVERINYVRFRQSLVTRIFGFYSAFLNCTGYGKERNELAVLLPAVGDEELKRSLRLLLPEYRISRRKYRPWIRTVSRFLIPPLTVMLGIALLFAALYLLFPRFRETTLFFALMAMVPAVWWFFVKIAAYFHVGIGIKEDIYTFRYTFGYAFFTAVLHKDKIARVEVRQSLFQKMSRCADVVVHPFSEKRAHFRLHNIQIDEVEAFLRILGR